MLLSLLHTEHHAEVAASGGSGERDHYVQVHCNYEAQHTQRGTLQHAPETTATTATTSSAAAAV